MLLAVPISNAHLTPKGSSDQAMTLSTREVLRQMDLYNVDWTSPSKDATGSMPIGNGQLGANVWVDESGTIHLLLARTDSWSEISRLLKLGEVTIQLSPNPFESEFRQTLVLKNGQIQIKGKGLSLAITFDPNHPNLIVSGQSNTPISVKATLGSWRTTEREIKGGEANSAWTMKDGPVKLFESADHAKQGPHSVIVYHRNDHSCVDFTLNWQGLLGDKWTIGDPLLHRTFGAMLFGKGFIQGDQTPDAVGGSLVTKSSVRSFAVEVNSACGVYEKESGFLQTLEESESSPDQVQKIERDSAKWWNNFWNRSYAFVTPPNGEDKSAANDCFHVTQSYILQRYMMACASRGEYPFKFNGSIFTVAPTWANQDYNADWRKWGDGYWWQNTRLGYWAMVANGDFEEMEPLFSLYKSVLALSEARTKLYYKAKGAYFPETISFFGTYAGSDYGWDRKPGQAPGDFDAEWWKYAWNQGPELVQMMLDRYNAQPNDRFLKTQLLPMARQVVLFFDTYFPRDEQGRLKLTPDQVVETYRNGVINDTPCIAGLHAILPRLLRLSGLPAEDKTLYSSLFKILPPVAVKDGRILAAEKFDPERFNVENAEFYAIWPFRQFGVLQGNAGIAATTYLDREIKDDFGWQYDGQTAALAGLTDEAKKCLLNKIRNSNPHFRFPAMWGPNYDWLPDQDHGGNILLTLQSMLLQTNDATGQVAICPAFPKEWNVVFKLYSTMGRVISGRQTDGSPEILSAP